jgi:hypothetical protein
MNTYILVVNNKDKFTFSSYEEAIGKTKEILSTNPEYKVKIYEEDYNDDLHCSDSCCRIYLMFEN